MAPEQPLKAAVVVLSSANSALWLLYTHSVIMSAVWAAIAVAFVVWLVRDVRNR